MIHPLLHQLRQRARPPMPGMRNVEHNGAYALAVELRAEGQGRPRSARAGL